MAALRGHGLSVNLPRGWHGEVVRRPGALPILHAATVPLPPGRADSGGGLVERLGWNDAFIGLLEHDPAAASSGLFSSAGVPVPLSPAWFTPGALQGMRPIQSGAQRFFTEHGRAFCLFVVVGEHARRARLLREVNAALRTLAIDRTASQPVDAEATA